MRTIEVYDGSDILSEEDVERLRDNGDLPPTGDGAVYVIVTAQKLRDALVGHASFGFFEFYNNHGGEALIDVEDM